MTIERLPTCSVKKKHRIVERALDGEHFRVVNLPKGCAEALVA